MWTYHRLHSLLPRRNGAALHLRLRGARTHVTSVSAAEELVLEPVSSDFPGHKYLRWAILNKTYKRNVYIILFSAQIQNYSLCPMRSEIWMATVS